MNFKNPKMPNMPGAGASGTLIKVVLIGGTAVYAALNSLYNVDGGHRAIVFNRIQGIKDKVYPEGTHLIIPWFERPIIYDVRARPHLVESTSGSRDLQMVKIGLRVLTRPLPDQLPTIYRTLGENYNERVLPSIIHETLKAVVAQYNASQLITQRESVSREIRKILTERASNFNLALDDVSITSLSFGKEFTSAIEAKQVAAQDAERAKFIVEKAEQDKKSAIIRAQVETPKNRGSRQMHRWYFRSTSTTIIRMWSSWLVHTSNDPFPSVPDNVVKVYLDLPDETFMDMLPKFDVVVLSSGHWFAKQSAYILNNTIVGGQLWTPKEVGQRQVNNMEAFGISVETSLMAIASHPLFTGLAIVRSFSPDHYEGGAWNTGGSCTGKVSPVTQVVRNGFTDSMHEKQVSGFQQAAKKAADNSKLILMDITEPFGYRPDGHPGPYRSPDPNKITKRGPNGEPPPQDCLHWCMPGPIDTWNEILLEIIRRELEHN